MVNTGRSYARQASSGMEEIMGGLIIWWCGRKLTLQATVVSRGAQLYGGHLAASGNHRGVTCPRRDSSSVCAKQPSQRLTLTPSLSLGERYDDNIFETQTNKQHDFITVLSPGIRVQYLPTAPTLGTQFDFDYRAAIEFFADHSSQNNVGHRLALIVSVASRAVLGCELA